MKSTDNMSRLAEIIGPAPSEMSLEELIKKLAEVADKEAG